MPIPPPEARQQVAAPPADAGSLRLLRAQRLLLQLSRRGSTDVQAAAVRVAQTMHTDLPADGKDLGLLLLFILDSAFAAKPKGVPRLEGQGDEEEEVDQAALLQRLREKLGIGDGHVLRKPNGKRVLALDPE